MNNPIRLDNGRILAEGKAADFEWTNIQSEEFRFYRFDHGFTVKITEPQWLYVSPSGGHRVLDSYGISHYIPAGWMHLSWKVKDGEPHFVY